MKAYFFFINPKKAHYLMIIALLYILSDGPNVNLRFLDIVREDKKDKNVKTLLEIGTCVLLTLHGAFKHRRNVNGRGIDKLLPAIKKHLTSHLQDELTMEKYLIVTSFHYNFISKGGMKTRLLLKKGFKCRRIW